MYVVLLEFTVTVPVFPGAKEPNAHSKADHCLYCEQVIRSRISKHLLNIHQEQPEIKEAIQVEGKQRQDKLYKVQCLGNFKHNVKVSTHTFPCDLFTLLYLV